MGNSANNTRSLFQAEVEDNNMRLLLLMMVMVFFITKATEGVPKGKGMEEPTQSLYLGDGNTFSLPGFLPVIPPIPYPLSRLRAAASFTDGDKLSICGG